MAHTFIRHAASPDAVSVGVLTKELSLGAVATVGRLIVFALQWNGAGSTTVSSVTDSAGNTWVACGGKFNQGDSTWQQFFATRVTSAGTGNLLVTATWTADVQFSICTLTEYSTTGTALIHIAPVHSAGSASPAVSPNYTVPFAEALVISMVYGAIPKASAEMTKAGPDENQFLSVFYRSRAAAGTYSETVTSPSGGYGMVTIAFDTLEGAVAGTAPSITTQPAAQTVTAGATANFTVAAAGTGTLAYQWQRNGVNISGAVASSYTTPATTVTGGAANSGDTYRCIVTGDTAPPATSNAAVLTVNAPAPTAPTITQQPSPLTVTAPAAAAFSVAASGSAPLAYQWQRNGVNIAGATNATYTLLNTTLGDSGASFTVTVSNAAGNVTSSAAVLTVGAPAPSPTPSPGPSPSPSPTPAPSPSPSGGRITSSRLERGNTLTHAGRPFVCFVNAEATGALVVLKTGLTTSSLGQIDFQDAALVAGQLYAVRWKRTDTGEQGFELLRAS